MKTRFPVHLRCALLLGVSLLAAGCTGGKKPVTGSPEALLEAEGEWALVEEQAPNPQQKHMSSRKQVNPQAQTGGHNSYTQSVAESGANDDVHFRVLRLERQMSDLQQDFDKILPPLGQKARADRELNTAVEEIEASRIAEIKPAAPVPEAKAPAEPPKKAEKAEQPVVSESKPVAEVPPAKAGAPSGALSVTGVRVGDHPGKTRLVFDLTGPTKFTAELDAAENLLVVELPGASSGLAAEKNFGGHPLLKSYSAQSSPEGTRLVFELKKSARLAMKTSMLPNPTYMHHRVVIDLAAN